MGVRLPIHTSSQNIPDVASIFMPLRVTPLASSWVTRMTAWRPLPSPKSFWLLDWGAGCTA